MKNYPHLTLGHILKIPRYCERSEAISCLRSAGRCCFGGTSRSMTRSLFFRWALFISVSLLSHKYAGAQTPYRGIVVDSATLAALPGVHVKIKNSMRLVTTDPKGMFSIKALPTDTLLFTIVGYHALELPLFLEETSLFIRLGEFVRVLDEVTIKSIKLQNSPVTRSARTLPRPLPKDDAIFNPLEYFSKRQKDKRKALKLIQENDRTLTYLQVILDDAIRKALLDKYELTESEYYELLVKFNKQSGALKYETDSDKIIDSLEAFLVQETETKK